MLIIVHYAFLWRRPRRPTLGTTVARLLCTKGRRAPGQLSGLHFPIHAGQLDAAAFTTLLRHGGHLPSTSRVSSLVRRSTSIADGVKGDKAIVDVTYDGPSGELPATFFVKFNLQALRSLPMRLLCEASEVNKCEALFYHLVAARGTGALATPPVLSPRAFFVDFAPATGEFILVSDVVRFGHFPVAPLKHRIRDAPVLEEVRALVATGATLNAALWCAPDAPPSTAALLAALPRFDETHRRVWTLMQLLGGLGLKHTVMRTLKGAPDPNAHGWMTWEVPSELVGLEVALVADMPALMRSLLHEGAPTGCPHGLLAYGHNDVVADNAFFVSGGKVGLVDWQQACVNSVGQEWAWNLHFLPPEFLTRHEDELVDLLLSTYAQHGRPVERAAFLRHYVLGTVQMFVFGGGGLQPLMASLHKRGLFASLTPDDPRCRDGSLAHEPALLEKMVGAEMTRRTFTNCCNIMRRHGFVREWARWRAARGLSPILPTE